MYSFLRYILIKNEFTPKETFDLDFLFIFHSMFLDIKEYDIFIIKPMQNVIVKYI